MPNKYIFNLTTGRSGSTYLASLLDSLPRVFSKNEPRPQFSLVLRRSKKKPTVAKNFWVNTKLPFIERNIKQDVYIELSHLFCKGFIEPLIQLEITPDIIILKRDNRSVAKSLYTLGTVPGRSNVADRFYVDPSDRLNVTTLKGWKGLSDYELCYWYTLEIDERTKKYESMFKALGSRIAKTSINKVKTDNGFEKLLTDLDLIDRFNNKAMKKYRKRRDKVLNKKDRKKIHNTDGLNFNRLEKRVERRTTVNE